MRYTDAMNRRQALLFALAAILALFLPYLWHEFVAWLVRMAT